MTWADLDRLIADRGDIKAQNLGNLPLMLFAGEMSPKVLSTPSMPYGSTGKMERMVKHG